MVVAPESLASLKAEPLALARDLIAKVAQQGQQITSLDQTITSKDREILYRQAKIDKFTHEMAVLKRLASSGAVANNSMRLRPVCWMKPSTPTS